MARKRDLGNPQRKNRKKRENGKEEVLLVVVMLDDDEKRDDGLVVMVHLSYTKFMFPSSTGCHLCVVPEWSGQWTGRRRGPGGTADAVGGSSGHCYQPCCAVLAAVIGLLPSCF